MPDFCGRESSVRFFWKFNLKNQFPTHILRIIPPSSVHSLHNLHQKLKIRDPAGPKTDPVALRSFMKRSIKIFCTPALLITLLIFSSCLSPRGRRDLSSGLPTGPAVLKIIGEVNGYWQSHKPVPGNAFWDEAAYQTGNMEAFYMTGNLKYKEYAESWAAKNHWRGAGSDIKSNWKYHYGETDDFVLFGDWQICFQTYIDLYNLDPVKDPKKIARALEVMNYQVNTPTRDYWWWADGLYMVMPVMTRMYNLTGDRRFLDKMDEYYAFADSLLFDRDENLFYRDAKYVFPKHKTNLGRKDFWARGNGWVFAAFARVLTDLAGQQVNTKIYVDRFKFMAEEIKKCQQPGGYWTRSLLDPDYAPGPETSGTAFFTYGLLLGINNSVLQKDQYLPVVKKAWAFLTKEAMQPGGRVGYVQPIGERAIPGQVLDKNSTANFGVGAFLLAASEMYRLVSGRNQW